MDNSNRLYNAIIALGRSYRSIKANLWVRQMMTDGRGRHCAVGQVTHHLGYAPTSTYACPDSAAIVAARALYDTLTPEQQMRLQEEVERITTKNQKFHPAENEPRATLRRVQGGVASEREYDTLVIIANDHVMRDSEEVAQWFARAVELLEQQLPIPPVRVPDYAPEPEVDDSLAELAPPVFV